MKKTTTLTLVAMAILSLTGCSCGWPRWLTRGSQCSTCTSSYGEGVYSSPSLIAPSYVAPPEIQQPLPGPIPPGA